MRIERMESAARPGWTMNEMKAEPMDFVRDFQEYLDQQTHHVNALSSSVNGEKNDEDLQTGERWSLTLKPLLWGRGFVGILV